MRQLLPFALALGASSLACTAQDGRPAQAPELGLVRWSRDLEGVLARKPEKPVLVLFQEIPG